MITARRLDNRPFAALVSKAGNIAGRIAARRSSRISLAKQHAPHGWRSANALWPDFELD